MHILSFIEKIRSKRRLRHKLTVHNGRKRDEHGLVLTTSKSSKSLYKGVYGYARYNKDKQRIDTGTLRCQFHLGTGRKIKGIIDCGNYDPTFLKRAAALQTDLWDEGGRLIVFLIDHGYNSAFLMSLYKKLIHLWLKTNVTYYEYQINWKVSLLSDTCKKPLTPKPKRSNTFKDDIFREYGKQCAVCQMNAATEAAHIIPVSNYGGCTIYNGIPLCKNHHSTFDKYLWTIDPSTYNILVHRDYTHQTLQLSKSITIKDKQRWHLVRQRCIETHYNKFLDKKYENDKQENKLLVFCDCSDD